MSAFRAYVRCTGTEIKKREDFGLTEDIERVEELRNNLETLREALHGETIESEYNTIGSGLRLTQSTTNSPRAGHLQVPH